MAAIIFLDRKEGQGGHHHSYLERKEGRGGHHHSFLERKEGQGGHHHSFLERKAGQGGHHHSFLLERMEGRAEWQRGKDAEGKGAKGHQAHTEL